MQVPPGIRDKRSSIYSGRERFWMIELINAVWTFLELLCLFIVSDSMLKPRENKRIVALVFSLVFGGCFGICNFYTGSLPLSYLSIPLWTLLICGCFHVNVAYVIISLCYFLGLPSSRSTIASGCVCFFAGIQIAELPNQLFVTIYSNSKQGNWSIYCVPFQQDFPTISRNSHPSTVGLLSNAVPCS